MALNVPGVIVVVVFYILILGIGLFAAWKSKKAETNSSGDRQEALLLGNRKIDWLVGIFTMTGKPSMRYLVSVYAQSDVLAEGIYKCPTLALCGVYFEPITDPFAKESGSPVDKIVYLKGQKT